jgi:hypothetical protein
MGVLMNFGAEHELHKRRMSKNIGLGIILVTFVALIFGLTVVKVTEGDVSGAIVGAASNWYRFIHGGNGMGISASI